MSALTMLAVANPWPGAPYDAVAPVRRSVTATESRPGMPRFAARTALRRSSLASCADTVGAAVGVSWLAGAESPTEVDEEPAAADGLDGVLEEGLVGTAGGAGAGAARRGGGAADDLESRCAATPRTPARTTTTPMNEATTRRRRSRSGGWAAGLGRGVCVRLPGATQATYGQRTAEIAHQRRAAVSLTAF